MAVSQIVRKWQTFAPQLQSVLRMVAAFMFMLAGTMKIFALPVGIPPNGGTADPLTEIWFGGMLEVFGGALLFVGLFTRPVAFILSGEMAVAYWQFHAPHGIWPNLNNGITAVLYCFLWLYLSAAGGGAWSLDAIRSRKRDGRKTFM
jgi:putative oxidoreductase